MPAATIPSPCVDVCRMHAASGLCEGCWRTLDEIAAWSVSGDDAKRAVWVLIEQRKAAALTPPAP
ncbi:MAG: DUF1289 domain-containing protein [Rhizobacter sp.]|nr:DUF1289 domain-containing protein [Rhizobacter sp.]